MILFQSTWDYFSPFIVWLVGYFFINFSLSRIIKLNKKRVLILYLWHSFWAIIYIILTLLYGNDSLLYFARAQESDLEFKIGTAAIVYITYFLNQKIYLSFLSIYAFFNIIGTFGLIIFDSIIRELNRVPKNLNWIINLLVFLPSVSFWSCAIGKDGIAFTAIIFFLWASLEIKKRLFFNLFSVIMMFLVRPHIAIIMIFSILIGFILSSKIKPLPKLFLTLFISVVTSYILIQALGYLGIDNINEINTFYDKRANLNLSGSIEYNKDEYPLLLSMISYIIRPSIFDINGPLALFAAIENTIISFLIFITTLYIIKGKRLPKNSKTSFSLLLTYFFTSLALLASTTSNLGIAMRQKWMFMPIFIYIMIAILNKKFKLVAIRKLNNIG
tara:strand:+ start:14332 stop:15492 length:1161 start_codon:yes stop_codon:yes gene_type:complete